MVIADLWNGKNVVNRKEPGLKINARYYYLIAFANTRIADQQDESQPGVWQPGAHTSAASPDPHLQLFEQNLEIQFYRRASAHYMEGDDQWNNESAMVLGEASLTLLEASGGSLGYLYWRVFATPMRKTDFRRVEKPSTPVN
ncbi:MAG: hypothetical protein Q9186_000676 [Xanthomendoza sp. 1 TL-2023]